MVNSALILIVEDNQAMRQGLCATLDIVDIGYERTAITAVDGLDALEKLRTLVPDLIICDIMMPRMDGFELLREVRANPAWNHIPFIFLSARGSRDEILIGQLSGADRYIAKPFDPDDLADLIRSQLDRTKQLQAQRARDMQELQASILQLLNHEFRTPLTYVTAYYEMMADSINQYSTFDFHDYLQGIQAGSKRLMRLVEDFMHLLDLRAADASLAFAQRARHVDTLPAIIRSGIAHGRARQADHPVQVHTDIPAVLPAVYGDPRDLECIVMHLVDNAVKFSHYQQREHGRVEVTARAEGESVLISVSDNGLGFPAEAIPHLADIFFQYNRDQLEQQGAGIGLSITKGLLDLHGGELTVASVVGEGSRFTIRLTAVKEGTPLAPLRSNTLPRPSARVLVVEDDPLLLVGLEELLNMSPGNYRYVVATAGNGREALATFASFQPDLVLSDILMPVMDGYELMEAVRTNPDWVHIPFLFLTAKGDAREKHAGLSSGAEEFLIKPYRAPELIGLVEKHLNRHFARRRTQQTDFELLRRSILTLLPTSLFLPLSSVSNYTEKLERLSNISTDAELRTTLEGIRASSASLEGLVEDFIALAELRTGEAAHAFHHRAAPIQDAALVAQETYFAWVDQAARARITVEPDSATRRHIIFGDLAMLTQCLQRLVQIGLRFKPAGEPRPFTIAYDQMDTEVAYCVEFDYALDPAVVGTIQTILANPTPENTQLADFAPSLTIVAGYVALHHGRLAFAQDNYARFSFSILLPVYVPATRP